MSQVTKDRNVDRLEFFRSLETNKADKYLFEKREKGFNEDLISEIERLIQELYESEELLNQAKMLYFEEMEAQESSAESAREDFKSIQILLEETQTEKKMLQESMSELESINERLSQRMKILLRKVEENEKEISDLNSALQSERDKSRILEKELSKLKRPQSEHAANLEASPSTVNSKKEKSPYSISNLRVSPYSPREASQKYLDSDSAPAMTPLTNTEEVESKEKHLLKEELEIIRYKLEMKEMANKLLSSKVSEISTNLGNMGKELVILKKQNSTLLKDNQALQNEKTFLQASFEIQKNSKEKEKASSRKEELITLVRRRNTLHAFMGKFPKLPPQSSDKGDVSPKLGDFKLIRGRGGDSLISKESEGKLQIPDLEKEQGSNSKGFQSKGPFYFQWTSYLLFFIFLVLAWNLKMGNKLRALSCNKLTALTCLKRKQNKN